MRLPACSRESIGIKGHKLKIHPLDPRDLTNTGPTLPQSLDISKFRIPKFPWGFKDPTKGTTNLPRCIHNIGTIGSHACAQTVLGT